MASVISRRVALMALAGSLAVPCAAAANATEKLRVGKAVSQAFAYIPLDVGMKHGIFQNQGLAIEEIDFAGGSKLAQAMVAGAVDIALSSGPHMTFASKGAPELAVATISDSAAFLGIAVGRRSPARNADDLRGKTIGVASSPSITSWLVEQLNRVKGWTREGERAIPVAIGGAPTSAFAALKTGEVDAFLGAVQVGYLLEEQQEGRMLLRCSDYVKELESAVTFASTALIEQNPTALRGFLKAWYETIRYMRSHREDTISVTMSVLGYSRTIAERLYDDLISEFSTNGRFKPRPLKTLFSLLYDLDIIDKSVDKSKLYTDRFLPKDLGLGN